MAYTPPHRRTPAAALEERQTANFETNDNPVEVKAYSSYYSFFGGDWCPGGGYETGLMESVQAALNHGGCFKAVVREEVGMVWCSREQCIAGSHWTISGTDPERLFTLAAEQLVRGELGSSVQAVVLAPKSQVKSRVQLFLADTQDVRTVIQRLQRALETGRYAGKCYSNREWVEKGRDYLCKALSSFEY